MFGITVFNNKNMYIKFFNFIFLFILFCTLCFAAPSISILSPTNTTYTTSSVPLNYTVNDSAAKCWYSLDNGANVSLVNCTNTTLTNVSPVNPQVNKNLSISKFEIFIIYTKD